MRTNASFNTSDYFKDNTNVAEYLQLSSNKDLIKKLLSKVPLLSLTLLPATIYVITRNLKILNLYYKLRSLLYSIPYNKELRLSKTE